MKKLIFIMTLLLSLTMSGQKSIDKALNKADNGITTIYTDSKDAVKTVYSDVKNISPKVTSLITKVADKLEVGANEVWIILVKQQVVWSICFLILTLTSLFNWILFYKRTQIKIADVTYVTLTRDFIGDIPNPQYDSYYFERIGKYPGDIRTKEFIKGPIGKEEYACPQSPTVLEGTFLQELFKYIHLAICLGLSYLSITHFSDMITGFMNPEFGAMKNIVELALTLK